MTDLNKAREWLRNGLSDDDEPELRKYDNMPKLILSILDKYEELRKENEELNKLSKLEMIKEIEDWCNDNKIYCNIGNIHWIKYEDYDGEKGKKIGIIGKLQELKDKYKEEK